MKRPRISRIRLRSICRGLWPAKVGLRQFVAAIFIVAAIGGTAGLAQDIQFFRIGTGSTGGTYFPIGSLISAAISNPPGSRPCDRGGSCGVPGLIAIVQSTDGSVENVQAVDVRLLESAFSQADVAFWAYEGKGVFERQERLSNLRVITNLFPESLHVVVRRNAGIRKIADLKGKRVSLDKIGSGTRVDALLILDAHDLSVDDMEVSSVGSGAAADMLERGELDAFFMVVGAPAKAIAELADRSLISLLPLDGPKIEELRKAYPFFSEDVIPSGTYFNVPSTKTVAVGAQWIVNASIPEQTVFEIATALWNESTRQLLDEGHPQGRSITLEHALKGVASPPLHPGAERFYREKGMIPIQ